MRRFQPAVLAFMLGAACVPARIGSVAGPGSIAMAEDGTDHMPAGDAPSPAAAAEQAPAAPWVAVRHVDVEPAAAGRRANIARTPAPDDVHQFLLSKPPRLATHLPGP